jgi:hypothetical protein
MTARVAASGLVGVSVLAHAAAVTAAANSETAASRFMVATLEEGQ